MVKNICIGKTSDVYNYEMKYCSYCSKDVYVQHNTHISNSSFLLLIYSSKKHVRGIFLDTWGYSSEPNSLTFKALILQQKRQTIKQTSKRNFRQQCRLYRKLKPKKGKERNCVRQWGSQFRYGGRGRPAEAAEQQHFIY